MCSEFMDLDENKFKFSQANGKLEKPFDLNTLRDLIQGFVPKTKGHLISDHLDFPRIPIEPQSTSTPHFDSNKGVEEEPREKAESINPQDLNLIKELKGQELEGVGDKSIGMDKGEEVEDLMRFEDLLEDVELTSDKLENEVVLDSSEDNFQELREFESLEKITTFKEAEEMLEEATAIREAKSLLERVNTPDEEDEEFLEEVTTLKEAGEMLEEATAIREAKGLLEMVNTSDEDEEFLEEVTTLKEAGEMLEEVTAIRAKKLLEEDSNKEIQELDVGEQKLGDFDDFQALTNDEVLIVDDRDEVLIVDDNDEALIVDDRDEALVVDGVDRSQNQAWVKADLKSLHQPNPPEEVKEIDLSNSDMAFEELEESRFNEKVSQNRLYNEPNNEPISSSHFKVGVNTDPDEDDEDEYTPNLDYVVPNSRQAQVKEELPQGQSSMEDSFIRDLPLYSSLNEDNVERKNLTQRGDSQDITQTDLSRTDDVTQTREITGSHNLDSLNEQTITISKELLSKESRQILEEVIKKIVPQLATEIIERELKRLLEERNESSGEN